MVMEETQLLCGKKRSSLSREDDGTALREKKRAQSFIVITGTDGSITTRSRQRDSLEASSARSKLRSSRLKQQLVAEADTMPSKCQRMAPTSTPSHNSTRQPSFSTPQPPVKSSLFQTPHNTPHDMFTPLRLPKTPRPPLSGRKLKSKAAAKLRVLDDQELQASRLLQARHDLLMERQERAYIAWLNHVLDRPASGSNRLSNFEDFVSRNSTMNTPSSKSNSTYSNLKLIDEVYWDEDRATSSPGNQMSLGRSPRIALQQLNGVGNRGFGSPLLGNVTSSKRQLKDVVAISDTTSVGQSPATPHLSSKRLKMITEHGFSYPRDAHMQDVCRLSELARRLKLHFCQGEREDIIATITQLAKHIDEGRLRMKKGCAIVADVALRKKALHVLLNYNAYWMRIGLHVVIGHTALLKERLTDDESKQRRDKGAQDAEFALLEVFLERHFLAHPGLAKNFATNKAIEGLYRDGYSEALGRVILKRFFLLVLVLDKAKSQTSLKISDGIDGLDGGSPPLFRSDARVKSSRQALQEFLSDVMHGEGDLIGNLSALGYHVHHHQAPLADYDFAVVDLIEDLQDGVRLCRLVQLLAANDTYFLEHIQIPSNGRKRQLHNCQIALESLAQAGVPLEDEDGCTINAADIVGGNRDKVFPLLWNIMVHLQIPVLVTRPRLCQEIAKLQGTEGDVSLGLNIGTVELLLKWTQVACMISGNLNVRNFKTSFADGQALCFIVNLYLPLLLPQNALLHPTSPSFEEEHMVMLAGVKGQFSSNYKKAVAHNFGLVQDVASKLGSIPEVLQLVDLLGDPDISERNIIIFVAFLCSRLLNDKPLDLYTIQQGRSSAWHFDDLLRCSSQCSLESESPSGFNRSYSVPWPQHEALCGTLQTALCGGMQMNDSVQGIRRFEDCDETLIKICKIQGWWRACLTRRRAAQKIQKEFCRFSTLRLISASKIQAHWRGFLLRREFKSWTSAASVIQCRYRSYVLRMQKRVHAAHVLQYYFRVWAQRKSYLATVSNMCKIQAFRWAQEARGNFLRERRAVRKIEIEWLQYKVRRRFHIAQVQWQESRSAQIVQAHWRGYYVRRMLIKQSAAASLVQSWFRGHLQRIDYRRQRLAAHVIQVQVRAWIQNRKRIQGQAAWKYITKIQAHWRGHVARRQSEVQKQAAKNVQMEWRALLSRRKRHLSAIEIQSRWRGHLCRCIYAKFKTTVITIQRHCRGYLERKRFQRQKQSVIIIQSWSRGLLQRRIYQGALKNACRIQAWWRAHSCRERFLDQKNAATILQRHWRYFSYRRLKWNLSAARIQARWRGYRLRKVISARNAAAVLIQSRFRGLVQRTSFTRYRAAAITIQANYRTSLQRRRFRITELSICKVQALWRAREAHERFFMQKQSAQKIQSAWRHRRTRRRHDSAIRIQGAWLSYSSKRVYSRWKAAAILIQSWYRGHIQRREYAKNKAAARIIQVQFKVWIQRKTFLTTISKICKLQTMWRAHSDRVQYLSTKIAVEKIQMVWRNFSAQRRRKAIQKIQATWRGHLVRKMVSKWRGAAILIQNSFRCYVCRRNYRKYRNAMLRCQAAWRNKLINQKIEACKKGVIRVQAAVRGFLERRGLSEQRSAACKIQSGFRAWLSKRVSFHAEQTLMLQVRSVTIIQAVVRGILQRRQFIKQRKAARRIQSVFRAWIAKRLFVHEEQEVILQLRSATLIQAVFKGMLQRRRLSTQSNAAKRIQSNVRAWLAKRVSFEDQQTLIQEQRSAAIIQAALRGFLQRHRLSKERKAASRIQSVFRSWHAKRVSFQEQRSATIIQAVARGFLQRQRLRKETRAASRIQSVFRSWHAKRQYFREEQTLSLVKLRSATVIQAVVRGMLQRHGLRKQTKSAIRIQSVFRARHAKRVSFDEEQTLTLEIESTKVFLCFDQKDELGLLEAAALRIESYYKAPDQTRTEEVYCDPGHEKVSPDAFEEEAVVNLHLQQINEEMAVLQAGLQSASARHSSFRQNSAAVVIQRYFRRRAQRLFQQLTPELRAVGTTTSVEKVSLSFHPYACPEELHNAYHNGRVQNAFRMGQKCCRDLTAEKPILLEAFNVGSNSSDERSVASRSFSPEDLNAGHVILSWLKTFVQRFYHVRLRRCTLLIQRHIRGWINRKNFAQTKKFVVCIQAHWRGLLVRRCQTQMKHPVEQLRQRIQSTAATVQDKERLCNRLTEALALLLSQKTVTGILSICRTIDVATQHSFNCCQRMAEAGAITKLLHLMQTINRSPPHEQVLKHSLSILNNLAHYMQLATLIAEAPGGISIISEQLNMSRNKEDIFSQAISVLHLVCKTSAGFEVLERERPICRRFQLIAQALERKIQVEKRNLDKLPWATTAMQRKLAQKKIGEANSQFLSIMTLLKEIKRISQCQPATTRPILVEQHTGCTEPRQSLCSTTKRFISCHQRHPVRKFSGRAQGAPFQLSVIGS